MSGPRQPSRGEHCDFDVLTATPSGHYIELGTIDVEGEGITQLAWFKRNIEPYVCRAGGDAAFAVANGLGIYIKATVLKSVPDAVSSSAATQPATPSGCKFDTQCKGDRICQKGDCVDPPPKP